MITSISGLLERAPHLCHGGSMAQPHVGQCSAVKYWYLHDGQSENREVSVQGPWVGLLVPREETRWPWV